jgi:UDP-3-O-[3-hydroxymyristoyl] glucosamine N-acyltransferase
MKYKANEIAEFLNTELIGNDIDIYKVSAIDELESNSLSFISKYGFKEDITKGALIIVRDDYEIDKNSKNSYIKIKKPKLAFVKVFDKFFKLSKFSPYISDLAVIKENVQIGNNCTIMEFVHIGRNCKIGNNVIIFPHVVIYPNTIIKDNVIINSGCKIGQEGFGYIKDENENYIQFPHIGKVIIEENVEIGSNTCIDRGALKDTVIGKNTKINNMCHIAHNVKIGKNSLITAKVEISGSVIIEDDVYIAPNSCIIDGIFIGKGSVIGMGSVVRKNVPLNSTIVPFEAVEIREYIKRLRRIKG